MKKIVLLFSTLIGMTIGVGIVGKTLEKKKDKIQNLSDKHLAMFLMMNQWVKIKQEGKNLAQYFEKAGYKNIAVYGMSYVGKTLVEELEGTSIQVVYGIDKNADSIYTDLNIMSIDERLEKVDAIVVTAITFFDEIEELLSKKMDCPILSLEDILYEI